MRRFWLVVLLGLTALGSVSAQQTMNFIGRYEDVKLIKQDTSDDNKFHFVRLIYNGQIPGYYKGWYTDYPKCDTNLIEGLKRLTNLNIGDTPLAIPINDPDLFKYPFIYTS